MNCGPGEYGGQRPVRGCLRRGGHPISPGTNHGIASRPSLLNAKTDYTLAWFAKYRVDEAAPD